MKTPQFPSFLYQRKGSFIDLVDEYNPGWYSDSTLLSMIQNYESDTIFDSNGELWNLDIEYEKKKVSTWEKILAYTFYNPRINTKVTFKKIRTYELDELKNIICKCIDADCDILTQFSEASVFINDIKDCHSFEEIISTFTFHLDAN